MKNAFRRTRRSRRRSFLFERGSTAKSNRFLSSLRRFEPLEPRVLLHGDDLDTFSSDPLLAPPADESGMVSTLAATGLAAESRLAPAQAEGEDSGPTNLQEFAEALTAAGTRFFGAFWCPHCNRQKAMMGVGSNDAPFIEVTEGDPAVLGSVVLNAVGRGDDTTLNPTGRPVNVFPTWEFADGTRLEGVQTLGTLSAFSGVPLPPNIVSFDTNFVDFDVELLPGDAPITVENFLNYINDGDYEDAFFHRFVPGFVLQGGGFTTSSPTFTSPNQFDNVPTDDPIQNEFKILNSAGTLAMAKLGGNPNSATSQWFINLGNNTSLNTQNGGFTVFARLRDNDLIPEFSQVTRVNAGSPFGELPLHGEDDDQLIVIESILGSGSVSGIVFDDVNENGVRNTGEGVLQGRVVYSDADGDGHRDEDELFAATSTDGSYTLRVAAGAHTLRLDGFPESSVQTVSVAIGEDVTSVDFAGREPVVRVRLSVTDLDGNVVTGVNLGERFILQVLVQDIRSNADGVFSAYQDITFDPLLVTALNLTHNGPAVGRPYGNGPVPDIPDGETLADVNQTPGLLDEVGSFSGSFSPLGPSELLLLEVEFEAIATGVAQFGANPADLAAFHDVGLYNRDAPVEGGEIEFVGTSLNIAANFEILQHVHGPNEDSAAESISINDLARLNVPTGTLTITQVGTAAHGVVTLAADGRSVSYRPNADYTGPDEFEYTISDGSVTGKGTVSIAVQPVNDPPVAIDDSFQDQSNPNRERFVIRGNVPNNSLPVLLNDSSAPDEPETLTIASVQPTSAQGGSVRISANSRELIYTPASGFVGQDTFTYTITDPGGLESQSATVTVNVVALQAVNDVFPQTGQILEDSGNRILDVLANDVSLDESATLTISAVGGRASGSTVTIVQEGSRLQYRPAANFFGPDTFTYTINDGKGGTATGTVTVNVTGVNDPPVANDDSGSGFRVIQQTSNNTLDVLANDSIAPDQGETLTIEAATDGSQGGSVSIAADKRSIRYTPVAGFVGTETFTYTIDDGSGLEDTATVTVSVEEPLPSSLSGFVYIDANNDGIKAANERGLAGVTVTLTGEDLFGTVNETTTTDSTGAYRFEDLAPGEYTISQTQPPQDFEGDGVPIIDGRDTIGSQGGSVSGNDVFQISLEEDTNGTGNNFGEVKGRTLGGVFNSGSALNGVRVSLFSADSPDQVFRQNSTVDGSFDFVGLPPATYTVLVEGTFLLPASLDATLATADSLNNDFPRVVRAASSYSFRDFLAPLSQHSVYAAVLPGAAAHEWYTMDTGWETVDDAVFRVSADLSTLELRVTEDDGQQLEGQISLPDPQGRARILTHQADGTLLVRLDGGRASYDSVLQPVTSGGSAEGELTAASTMFAVPSLPAIVTPPAHPAATTVPALIRPVVDDQPRQVVPPAIPVASEAAGSLEQTVFVQDTVLAAPPSGSFGATAVTSSPLAMGEGESATPLLLADSTDVLDLSTPALTRVTSIDPAPLVDAAFADSADASQSEPWDTLADVEEEETLWEAVDYVFADEAALTTLL